ncbi:MAG: aminopeptidase P N-terminal domain-containing protein [Burkholderiales bacterium]|nr:aminopeptidase P N-terminal domain-containing protein [Burkholderiales bacterium]
MKNAHLVHRERRTAIAGRLREQGGGIVVLPTAPEALRNRDSHWPYRHDSYFYYLTGFPEPDAVVALVAGADADRHILFCREKNVEREIWDGFRYGPDAAREVFGFDETYPIGELDGRLSDLVADQPALHTFVGLSPEWDRRIAAVLNEVRGRVRNGVSAPDQIVDVRGVLDRMRRVKDAHELALMRRAASISSDAHARAMAAARPGWHEYQVEAELVHEFLRQGAQALAYPPIVASGPNACVLHYRDNDREMSAGDLLLIDAGCEYRGYASDITRTFPVGGRFDGAQKAIYELVLEAQMRCLDAVRPGVAYDEYHRVAERVLAQGLIDIGLIAGPLDAALESGSYKRFYMHRAGHWLGMDVHDAGLYRHKGGPVPLEPGMVLTVEPGLYIRPGEGVPEEFHDIGVRIEDDVVVTADGHENLTARAPKTVADVEAACGVR